MPPIVTRLVTDSVEVVLAGDGRRLPAIVHFGAPLGDPLEGALFDRLLPGGGLDVDVEPSIVAEPARGWFGVPGISTSRTDGPASALFTLESFDHTPESLSFVARDATAAIELAIAVALSPAGALTIEATITNRGTDDLHVHALNVSIPVGAAAAEVLTLGGRHAMEFCEERTSWGRSVVSVASRRGRTSHEQQPTVFAGSIGFGEADGEVWGVHLAWSGNHQLVCDGVTDGRRIISAGELLVPGEVRLAPGDSHRAPTVVAAFSSDGLDGVSRALHSHARSVRPVRSGRRPVILNTWEAVYFDHDLDRLRRLADVAAACGIERFVLDDGWFRGRRDDTAGLGDWLVDETVWPDGLAPLIDHVRAVGMDFGLWVEPEMVNPDSAMHRAHPEWALETPGHPRLLGRHQLVLDLGRHDVREHLFERLDALLGAHPIAHVKWDHNRDLVWSGSHDQTRGFYELLERLRAAHPSVDFESCASGGGRIDLGVCRHVQRFWTSDSIDALDRLAIQRGFSRVFPPEMMGAHIGSPVCHTTGRRHALAFRALSAMPGWLGVEWNLLEASEHELERLAEVIAIHKQHRDLLHSGDAVRFDHPDAGIVAHGVVALDRSEALVTIARVANGPAMHSPPLRLTGLDADARYRLQRIRLGSDVWALHRRLPTWVDGCVTASGRQLSTAGLPMPPLLPESGLLVHLCRES